MEGEGVDILIAGIEGQKDGRHSVTCIGEEVSVRGGRGERGCTLVMRYQ